MLASLDGIIMRMLLIRTSSAVRCISSSEQALPHAGISISVLDEQAAHLNECGRTLASLDRIFMSVLLIQTSITISYRF